MGIPLFNTLSSNCYPYTVQISELSVGDRIQLSIERIAYGGEGVARFRGLVVFVPLAATGDSVWVRITERRKRFARGRIETISNPSPLRRQPLCPHFGECGGCQLQHLTYDAQLEAKGEFVLDALKRIGQVSWSKPIEVKSAAEYGYRNRAQVRTELSASRGLRVGFNRLGSHSVRDIDACPVLTPELNSALATLRSALHSNTSLHEARQFEMAEGDAGVACRPPVPGLGEGPIDRAADGAVYRFGVGSFFQANRFLIDELVSTVVENEQGLLAVELYAGVGLFTVQLARRFTAVVAVESDRASADFARENLSSNGVANAEIHMERAESWCHSQLAKPPADLDLLLLNPPRTGAADVIKSIAELRPRRVVYVSCDPATLARDLRVLVESGYDLDQVTAFDLFPQTYHVETVARLSLRAAPLPRKSEEP